MGNRLAAFAVASALGLIPLMANPVVATAQVVEVEPGYMAPPGAAVTAEDARDIAEGQGVRVSGLEFDSDDARWQVEGRDFRGRWVEMEIDANTGVIIELDR